MRLAIMQPYFLPYIGYYQLIASVDVFVVYDNIKYTKKGWINRNRMLLNDAPAVFSLPLKKGSDSLDVKQRELASDYDREKLLNRFRGAYCEAPYFAQTFSLLTEIVRCEKANLFDYIHHSIVEMCAQLDIDTRILVSSKIGINHDLKAQDKVLAICESLGADVYINAIGGTELYSAEDFRARDIELNFIKTRPLEYEQFRKPFVPWLSMVDVLMFNSPDQVSAAILNGYELIGG